MSRKIWATEMKKCSEADLHHFGLWILYKSITGYTSLCWIYFSIWVLLLLCVCAYIFFFLPFLKQLQNQSLCQHWTARGKGKGLAISNAFKFIRVLDVFSRLSLLTATPVPLWILMTCNRGHQSWSIQARDITMPKVIVPLA